MLYKGFYSLGRKGISEALPKQLNIAARPGHTHRPLRPTATLFCCEILRWTRGELSHLPHDAGHRPQDPPEVNMHSENLHCLNLETVSLTRFKDKTVVTHVLESNYTVTIKSSPASPSWDPDVLVDTCGM
ncbi:hypothetical protein E2C01_001167 [Portunus trituberculatus]|uniref:Uncharacterized protein n=1 Tax=Portunus trituberculatus TaxID=210409 RepID=A0A5B7CGG3_PORTR|nr:hypothetical protein [Portunus trituberculatus]